MRIAAHDRLAGQREAQLRPDHVDDTLALVEQRDVGHVESGDIGFQRRNLCTRLRLDYAAAPVLGRDIVIDHRERRSGPPHRTSGPPQPVEGLRTVHLVQQVPVDIEHARLPAEPLDDMGVPDLVVAECVEAVPSCPVPLRRNLDDALSPCKRGVRFISTWNHGRHTALFSQQAAALDPLAVEIGTYAHDPLGFVMFAFPWGEAGTVLENNAGPEPWQCEVLQEIGRSLASASDAIRIAVASGHGVGKSALVAWIIVWALATFRDARGVDGQHGDAAQDQDLARTHQVAAARRLRRLV